MSESTSTPPPEIQDVGSQALAEALRSSFIIVKIALVALVVIIFAAGFFAVNRGEKAIVLRFGNPRGEGQQMLLGPGLHWAFPYPIDEVIRIPISEIQQVSSSVGWYATTPEQELAGTEPFAGPSLNPAVDGYVITADRNIIHARATVSYHIDDPRTAIFNFTSGTNHGFSLAGVSNAVQNAANNALVATAARFTVDDILTRDPEAFRVGVELHVSELARREHLGVVIDQCQIKSAAPRQLKEVFGLVTAASQNREKIIQDAIGEQNRILSAADAWATSITNNAEADRIRFVSKIQADADTFAKILPQYRINPRLYAEMELARAMPGMLTNVQDKIFWKSTDGKMPELRLLLSRELPQPRTTGNPQ